MKNKTFLAVIAFGLCFGAVAFMLLPVRYATYGKARCPNLPYVDCGPPVHEKNLPFVLKLLDKEEPAYVFEKKVPAQSQPEWSGTDYQAADVKRSAVIAVLLAVSSGLLLARAIRRNESTTKPKQ